MNEEPPQPPKDEPPEESTETPPLVTDDQPLQEDPTPSPTPAESSNQETETPPLVAADPANESGTSQATPVAPDPEKQERDWTMYTHLSGLCGILGIPSPIGPLIFWYVKKDTMPKVNQAGKDAINFQLTMLIIELISVPLVFFFVGFFTMMAALILSVVFAIIAGVEASKGNEYKYPFSFPMIK